VRHYGDDQPFRIVRCEGCGLAYVSPRPDREQIREYYPQQYQADMNRVIGEGWTNPFVRMGLRMILRRRLPPVPPGRLLDVGCTVGRYLLALRERGWHVQGIEIDPYAAQYARSRHGLDVRTGDAEDLLGRMEDASFDVVTMWHVLEHLFDPTAVLTQVRRILKPGGLLMMELPNFKCPFARLFGDYWFPLEVPRHLYQFTPRTLKSMAQKAGLEPVTIKGVPSPEAVALSLLALGKRRTGDLKGEELSLSPLLLTLAFPLSWLMARLDLSDHMATVLVRPRESSREEINPSREWAKEATAALEAPAGKA